MLGVSHCRCVNEAWLQYSLWQCECVVTGYRATARSEVIAHGWLCECIAPLGSHNTIWCIRKQNASIMNYINVSFSHWIPKTETLKKPVELIVWNLLLLNPSQFVRISTNWDGCSHDDINAELAGIKPKSRIKVASTTHRSTQLVIFKVVYLYISESFSDIFPLN